MVSVLLLFNLPVKEDADEHRRWLTDSSLETALSQHFIPALKQVPGLKGLEVSRSLGGPEGVKRYDRAIRLLFDDEASMRAAVASPEARKVVAMAMGHLRIHDISITFFEDRAVEPG